MDTKVCLLGADPGEDNPSLAIRRKQPAKPAILINRDSDTFPDRKTVERALHGVFPPKSALFYPAVRHTRQLTQTPIYLYPTSFKSVRRS